MGAIQPPNCLDVFVFFLTVWKLIQGNMGSDMESTMTIELDGDLILFKCFTTLSLTCCYQFFPHLLLSQSMSFGDGLKFPEFS